MAFPTLLTNQIPDAALRWYADFLAAASDPNWRRQLPFFADDALLQANNRVPAHGQAAIAAELDRYWRGFSGIRHEPVTIFGYDNHFAVEMLCHYTLEGGKIFTLPAAGFLSRNAEGRITALRVFADVTEIFG